MSKKQQRVQNTATTPSNLTMLPNIPKAEDAAQMTFGEIGKIIRDMRLWIQFLEENWNIFREEFGVTDDQMKALIEYNTEVAEPPPEVPVMVAKKDDDGNDVLDEDGNVVMIEVEHDQFNGLNSIPMDKIVEIFGAEHPIIGLDLNQTIDRLKDLAESFHGLYDAHKNYAELEKMYVEAIEESEYESIEALKRRLDEEEDPTKKAKYQESIDMYYDNKYINIIPGAAANNKHYLTKAFSDPSRIEYMLTRTRNYMKSMNIPEKFILQISSFEKRFLSEKFWKLNNMLLLFFMNMIVYQSTRTEKDVKQRIISFVLALDKFTRGMLPDEEREKVLNNIILLEEIFVDEIDDGGDTDG